MISLRERQRLIMTFGGTSGNAHVPEQTEREIRSLVQCFEGSHIGIMQRGIGTIRAFQRSEVLEVWEPLESLLEDGVDLMAVFVDECHRCGIQAWGSRRMNDGHHTYKALDVDRYQTRFYRENPELRLKSHGKSQLSASYDWNKPQIAEQNLAFMQEVAENYDVDGMDLDFTRIPPFFNPDEKAQGREAMNKHVRDVRSMLDEVGVKKGKSLGLSAQLYAEDSLWKQFDAHPEDDIQVHFNSGLDVCTWAREGFLDYLIAHCHSDNLFEMGISAWGKAVEGTSCRLVAGPGKPVRFKFGRGGLIDGFPVSRTNRVEHRAIAHRLYEQGAAGVFFYDYVIRENELQWEVFRELGDPERIRHANKKYVFQMALPLNLGLPPEGGEAEMEIDVPDDIPTALAEGHPVRTRLLLNITNLFTPNDIALQVNGQDVTIRREHGITTPLTITDHPEDSPQCHLEAVVNPGLLVKGRNRLSLRLRPVGKKPPGFNPQPSEVRKVDLEVVYRDETYPYWLALQLDQP